MTVASFIVPFVPSIILFLCTLNWLRCPSDNSCVPLSNIINREAHVYRMRQSKSMWIAKLQKPCQFLLALMSLMNSKCQMLQHRDHILTEVQHIDILILHLFYWQFLYMVVLSLFIYLFIILLRPSVVQSSAKEMEKCC